MLHSGRPAYTIERCSFCISLIAYQVEEVEMVGLFKKLLHYVHIYIPYGVAEDGYQRWYEDIVIKPDL